MSTPEPHPTGRDATFWIYCAFALMGFVGTQFFNFRFFASDSATGYLTSWFANDAASSAALDLFALASAAFVFMIAEARRLKMKAAYVLVPLSFVIAIGFTFPLFMALRHRLLVLGAPAQQPLSD